MNITKPWLWCNALLCHINQSIIYLFIHFWSHNLQKHYIGLSNNEAWTSARSVNIQQIQGESSPRPLVKWKLFALRVYSNIYTKGSVSSIEMYLWKSNYTEANRNRRVRISLTYTERFVHLLGIFRVRPRKAISYLAKKPRRFCFLIHTTKKDYHGKLSKLPRHLKFASDSLVAVNPG
jgi:hypothetical protein